LVKTFLFGRAQPVFVILIIEICNELISNTHTIRQHTKVIPLTKQKRR